MTSLQIENISYKYNSKETSGISNFSLSLNNSVHSIVGPSGSGKTTIQKIINGELKAQTGTMNLNEFRVKSLTHIAGESLNSELSPIKFLTTKNDDINKARDLLFKFEITNTIHRTVKDLSNGEKQRLFLASFLMNEADLYLFDETFSGIDFNTRQTVIRTVFDYILKNKGSVIWSTQLIDEAIKYSQTMSVLQFGQVEDQNKALDIYFKPRSLFTANFFGANNVLLLKKENSKVFSIFKQHNFDFHKEGILIIRPQFIYLGDEYQVELVSSDFDGKYYLNTAVYKEKKIRFHTNLKLNDKKVGIKIDWEHAHFLNEV